MNYLKITLLILFVAFYGHSFAQQQQQEKPKTPIEMAADEADKLYVDLKLSNRQLFLIDSVLQANYTGITNDFEKLKSAGRQTNTAFIQVREAWLQKTEDAFKLILNEEQFKKYLIKIGKMDSKGRPRKQPKYY